MIAKLQVNGLIGYNASRRPFIMELWSRTRLRVLFVSNLIQTWRDYSYHDVGANFE